MQVHNKSQNEHLSILDLTDQEILQLSESHYEDSFFLMDGPIEDSPCLLCNPIDGRLTFKGKKVGFAYQIAAFQKYGRK